MFRVKYKSLPRWMASVTVALLHGRSGHSCRCERKFIRGFRGACVILAEEAA